MSTAGGSDFRRKPGSTFTRNLQGDAAGTSDAALDVPEDVQEAVDDTEIDWAPSYVLTRPPELRLVYGNRLTGVVYQLPWEAIRNKTLWEILSDPRVIARATNVEEYYRTAVQAAKGLLDISDMLGAVEQQRVAQLVQPFEAYAKEHYPTVWATEDAAVFAMVSSFKKVLKHWDDGHRPLLFEARANYRPDWKLFHIVYYPYSTATKLVLKDVVQRMSENSLQSNQS